MQFDAPAALTVPAGQPEHDAAPAALNVPEEQGLQAPFAPKLPAGQGEHVDDVPPGLVVPAEHSIQTPLTSFLPNEQEVANPSFTFFLKNNITIIHNKSRPMATKSRLAIYKDVRIKN